MPRFFRRLAEGVFDLEDLHGRTQELADWIDTAARQYGFDKSKLVAVGYSNGANIAASLLLSRPESLAHAILLRAMLPFEPAVMPDLSAKRILMENGKRDTVIPAASSARLFEVLEAAGADVTFRLNGGGHGIDPAELEEARDWFQAL
jgi:phospholipase/carboxylesterase